MIVTIDIESYYDRTTYSLGKLREAAYILDERFELLMLGMKINDGKTVIHEGDEQARAALAAIDWSRAAMVGHNLRFDGAILAWRYGVVPKLYLDTMAMARATIFAHTGHASLEATAKYLRLPEKGKDVLDASGKHRGDFTDEEWESYKEYCRRDTDITKLALNKFVQVIPKSELRTIDATVRMFTEPQVQLDRLLLGKHLIDIRQQKKVILDQSGLSKELLSSQSQFAAWLKGRGIQVPTKQSPTNPKFVIPALAKGDRAFKELCQREDLPYEVEVALQARIDAKSTGEETRTEALLTVSALNWGPSRRSGSWSPVPLRYYGARTGRFSGDGGFNWQNFRRASRIREAVVAPPGYLIVHRDASQIEARMVADLADCRVQSKAFRDPKRDIYCEFATEIYGRSITKKDKLERFVGKTAILSLGYSCGHLRFREALFIGNGGISVSLTEEKARDVVISYRQRYNDIPTLWRRGDNLLRWMAATANRLSTGMAASLGSGMPYYPVVDIDYDAVHLPNGMAIQYPGLRPKPDPSRPFSDSGFVYDDPHLGEQSMYGGKFLENISQALCRIIITDIIERVRKATDYYPFLTTHDSLDYCVPIEDAVKFDQMLAVEFAKAPTWAPKLPLASEGGWGRTLAAAERGENA